MDTEGAVHPAPGRPAQCPDCGAPMVERAYGDICPRCDDVLAPFTEAPGRVVSAADIFGPRARGEVRVA